VTTFEVKSKFFYSRDGERYFNNQNWEVGRYDASLRIRIEISTNNFLLKVDSHLPGIVQNVEPPIAIDPKCDPEPCPSFRYTVSLILNERSTAENFLLALLHHPGVFVSAYFSGKTIENQSQVN